MSNRNVLNKTGRRVERNIEALSRNYFCRRKDTGIEYYVCVCVLALINRYANHIFSVLHYVIMVRDRIPVGTRFSARPDRSWGPPSPL